MERIPTNERAPSLREKTVEALRVNSPEGIDLLKEWMDEQQAVVERGESTNLEFNIALAEVYRDAGLLQDAIETFESTADIAYYEGNDERVEYCESQVEMLRATLQ